MTVNKKGEVTKRKDGLENYIPLAIGAPPRPLSPRKQLLASMSFPPGMSVVLEEEMPGTHPDSITLAVSMLGCKDSDGGDNQTVMRVTRFDYEMVEAERDFVMMVYREARNLWTHEFDEFCRVAGRPVREPHPEIHGTVREWMPGARKKKQHRMTATEVRQLANDCAIKGVGR